MKTEPQPTLKCSGQDLLIDQLVPA